MRWWQALVPLSLGSLVSGCNTEPGVCTRDFRTITAAVVDGAGQPRNDVTAVDTVRRTGAVLDVTAISPSIAPGFVVVFSDAFLQAVARSGDQVIVVATSGDQSSQATYLFGSDGCHVRKLAGPDTLVVS